MAKIKLKVLTPLHVGSGIELQGNFEYLYFRRDNKIVVIDEEKVFNIIDKEEIKTWTGIIEEKGDLLKYLQKRKQDLRPIDIAKRIMNIVGYSPTTTRNGQRSVKPIREQLHNGMDKVLVPGSSIKGSIRTAVLAGAIYDDEDSRFTKKRNNLVNRYAKYNDAQLVKNYLGKDPNQDIFRLLHVGDAHFTNTDCYHCPSINLMRDRWQFKHRIEQFVECISPNATSEMEFSQPKHLIEQAKRKNYFKQNISVLELPNLFENLRNHFSDVISNELDFWEKENNPHIVIDYIESLENLYDQIEACKPNECIIRMGFGTGYKNITGDWQKENMLPRDVKELERGLRHRRYEGMLYPKTRRMTKDGQPLGFLKMSY